MVKKSLNNIIYRRKLLLTKVDLQKEMLNNHSDVIKDVMKIYDEYKMYQSATNNVKKLLHKVELDTFLIKYADEIQEEETHGTSRV
ncbi:MAG: hypothetical protein LBS95_00870 [Mycoplasmataceae bacterium]|jgi:hypothetical protein|nr:hypothetical protein [Mycoplasmataceae bacterium]